VACGCLVAERREGNEPFRDGVANPRGYDLRWFTPLVEVDLCGHATLAAARVLSHLAILVRGVEVSFTTRSGLLRAGQVNHSFVLDFPVQPAVRCDPPPELTESLSLVPRSVARNRSDYLVEVDSESILRSVRPDFRRLSAVPCRGVIVTSPSEDTRYDFVSRFFAPASGIDEDPVTGSAHCCLADFWGKRLGRNRLVGYQASARGGVVTVERRGERVLLIGDAVLVAQGELLVP
jgi:predicted PhzF superfamily epimerase YddE/YHI9